MADKVDIKLIKQPNGISCGNTCLKMIMEYIGINRDVTIQEIIEVCGTNAEHGTRHIEMIKGLEYYNIPYNRTPLLKQDDPIKQIAYLDSVLERGNVFLLRTLTHNIFHWVIVTGKNDVYYINDPWLGSISYDMQELISIWKPRDYDGFEILL
jgi:ABC-type bacteriocin/lantibiotic exporter with double-glycine peptidase domain